jgi:FKBP-type peptidyl-prolyl cis-trans isomerase
MKKYISFMIVIPMTISLSTFAQKNKKGTALESLTDSVSYSFGLLIGDNMKTQGVKEVNQDLFLKGFNTGYSGEQLFLTKEDANAIVQEYFNNLIMNEKAENLQESIDFLLANKEKEGVVTLPSGLQYKVLEAGEGPSPKPEDQVKVHYTGSLIDGTIFDSSIERGEPIVFGVSQVIPGWTEALQLMSPGARWMLYIPPALAYGENGAGGVIGPNQALIFEVELIEINPE